MVVVPCDMGKRAGNCYESTSLSFFEKLFLADSAWRFGLGYSQKTSRRNMIMLWQTLSGNLKRHYITLRRTILGNINSLKITNFLEVLRCPCHVFVEDIDRLRKFEKKSLYGSQLFSGPLLSHVDDSCTMFGLEISENSMEVSDGWKIKITRNRLRLMKQ